MKIIIIDVMSLDGKLTKWGSGNVHEWSSKEDFDYFSKTRDSNDLLVMGSGTFDAVRPQPERDRLRIVLTSNPDNYVSSFVAGQMEFSDEQPEELVERLDSLGYKQMLIVGGKSVGTSFLQKNLVNELWITVEPRIFGVGDAVVGEERLDVCLELIKLEVLNKQGTLLLKYRVL